MRALEEELPDEHFNTWVRPLQAVESSGALKLLAPNRFAVDWVNAHLLSRLGEIVRRFVEGDAPILTVVDLSVSLVGVMVVLPAALVWAEQHGPFRVRDLLALWPRRAQADSS